MKDCLYRRLQVWLYTCWWTSWPPSHGSPWRRRRSLPTRLNQRRSPNLYQLWKSGPSEIIEGIHAIILLLLCLKHLSVSNSRGSCQDRSRSLSWTLDGKAIVNESLGYIKVPLEPLSSQMRSKTVQWNPDHTGSQEPMAALGLPTGTHRYAPNQEIPWSSLLVRFLEIQPVWINWSIRFLEGV